MGNTNEAENGTAEERAKRIDDSLKKNHLISGENKKEKEQ